MTSTGPAVIENLHSTPDVSLAELGIAPLRVTPGPDAAELVLLAHVRRVHDSLGCRSFLVASADRRFAALAKLEDIAHRVRFSAGLRWR